MTIKVTISHDERNSGADIVVNTLHVHPDGESEAQAVTRLKPGTRAEFWVHGSQHLIVREAEGERS